VFSLLIRDGDIVIEDGELQLVEGEDEVAQCVDVALNTNQGEWFFNPNMGIDYSKVLGKSTDAEARNTVIQGISQETRIDTIDELNINTNRADRTREISFKASSDEGVVESEVTING